MELDTLQSCLSNINLLTFSDKNKKQGIFKTPEVPKILFLYRQVYNAMKHPEK